MFYRRSTDGTRQRVELEGVYAGGTATPCWIIGGGPSLCPAVRDEILRTPAARFAVNLAGTGLLRPTFWTSYDPTARFHRSIYLDASVTKFVHECRAMDLVPETTLKVCDCPATYFFERTRDNGFQDFPGRGSAAITDWQDSLIQAIDIAYRLGFRDLYLAGCDLWIAPGARWQHLGRERGVFYEPRELLGDYAKRCEEAGLSRQELEGVSPGEQYHFAEAKPLAAAIQTDFHYFQVTQYLRLSRRALGLAGLRIYSVTAGSRLNDLFPYLETGEAAARILADIGDPAREETRGRYTDQTDRRLTLSSPMRDFRPHFWPARPAAADKQAPLPEPAPASKSREQFRQIARELQDVPVDLHDPG